MSKVKDEAIQILEARLLDATNMLYYDMVIEGDYDYLLPYCKNGIEYINILKKLREDKEKYFLINLDCQCIK